MGLSEHFRVVVADNGTPDWQGITDVLKELISLLNPVLLVTNSRGIRYAHGALFDEVNQWAREGPCLMVLSPGNQWAPVGVLEGYPGPVVVLSGRHDTHCSMLSLIQALEVRSAA